MRIPAAVKKAIHIIAGYCAKHTYCDDCPLKWFCEHSRSYVPSDWELEDSDSDE